MRVISLILLCVVVASIDYRARITEKMMAPDSKLLQKAQMHLTRFDTNGDGLINESEATETFTNILGQDEASRAVEHFFGEVDMDRGKYCTSYNQTMLSHWKNY